MLPKNRRQPRGRRHQQNGEGRVTATLRDRYRSSSKNDKGRILDVDGVGVRDHDGASNGLAHAPDRYRYGCPEQRNLRSRLLDILGTVEESLTFDVNSLFHSRFQG